MSIKQIFAKAKKYTKEDIFRACLTTSKDYFKFYMIYDKP